MHISVIRNNIKADYQMVWTSQKRNKGNHKSNPCDSSGLSSILRGNTSALFAQKTIHDFIYKIKIFSAWSHNNIYSRINISDHAEEINIL